MSEKATNPTNQLLVFVLLKFVLVYLSSYLFGRAVGAVLFTKKINGLVAEIELNDKLYPTE